ncbi:uncharacterized protein LOC129613050 [Condylostylus longicornis]|uniref:uncharacterized protein LOC129613050 n=1 Tax=Condylostylus longicornis TaxID=2530218 RepID=UPI00244E1C37|nr:uncharacterized protein LOC129613050 [Condylostylus longicornis]
MEKIASTRVFKKTSANSILSLYLGSRDLISRDGTVEPLRGVIYIDPKFMCSQKIYGQLTLTFRYGREDEEVMGLKFCNEAVIAIKQIWPRINFNESEVTPLQQALVDRLGPGAHPFSLEIGTTAPPSVQLVPAKKYCGAPIGTSYDIRIYMNEVNDEKFFRRTSVKLGIRLLHKIPPDLRIIQQINPIYTSLPKSIRLRLSPKQLKFHHNKTKTSSVSTLKTTALSQSTTNINNPNISTSINLNYVPSSISAKNCNNKDNNMTAKLLAATTTTTFKTIASTTNTIDSNDEILVVDEKGNTHPGNGIGVSSGLTIRLPTAPTAAANIDTHPLTLNCYNSSSSSLLYSKDYIKPILIDPNKENDMKKQEVTNGNSIKSIIKGSIDKSCPWSEGRVSLSASLNKSAFAHGESVFVKVDINNKSKKIIRKIRVFAVQHVDVCMFSNGKFKNVVADVNENHQIKPNESYSCIYNLIPIKGTTKNWIAVEGTYSQGGSIGESPTNSIFKLASSVHRGPTLGDRNVFAIYVSYYVKVKLNLSGMGGEVALKLPFTLGYVEDDSHNCSCNHSDNDSDNDDTIKTSFSKIQIDCKCDCNKEQQLNKDIVENSGEYDMKSECDSQATTASLSITHDNNRCEEIYEHNCKKQIENCNTIESDINKDISNKHLDVNGKNYLKLNDNKIIAKGKTTRDEIHEKKSISCTNCINFSKNDLLFKNIRIEEEYHNEKYEIEEDSCNHNLSEDSQETDSIKIKLKQKEEKTILQNIKLKRSSYSRSCEDIETFSKFENCKFVSSDCSWNGPDDQLMLSNADSIGTDD